jgi:PAS domain S-box-containing protein
MSLQNDPDKRAMMYWRERILLAILGVGLAFALFLFVPMTMLAIRENHWAHAILNAAVYGSALAVFFFRGLPYELRAGCTLLLTFVLGTHIIVRFGLLTGGPVCLFAFAVMAGLLLGRRAAVGALLVNAAILFLFGWLAAHGRLVPSRPLFSTPLAAVMAWGTFLLMNAVTAISAAVMVRGMNELAERERASKEELRREMEERARAEEALRESERAYRLLAENATDVIWTLDPRTLRFTYVSPSVQRMLGLSPEEAVAQGAQGALHPDCLRTVTQALQEEIERDGQEGVDPKRSRMFELRQRNRDGAYVWVEVTVAFLRDEAGRPVGVLGVSRDIQQRKLAEEEKERLQNRLRESQRMEALASLAGGIAHQFNNALSVILGQVEILEEDLLRGQNEEFQPIRASARRMVELTSQLLAYARGGRYQARVLPTARWVRGTLDLVAHLLPQAVQVETDLREGLHPVEADEAQLQMVLSAVIFNAAEAIEDHGHVHISSKNLDSAPADPGFPPDLRPGPHVQVTVEDSGKGMDEEERSRIFDPFFTTKFQGRGLGMAAAYGVVRNHGGWIDVASEPGRGTTVRILLPAAEKVEEAAARERPAPGARTGTVLLVEDEEMVMDVARVMLVRLGFRVLPARTGRDALERASETGEGIDLALLDLKLPDMDAAEVYAGLTELLPGIKVIVCSGYSLEGPAQEILNQGADGFLQKPFTMNALAAKIDEVL